MFIQRVCKNILPTYQNLQKRKIIEIDLCPIFYLYTKFAVHAIWDYDDAKDVWSQSCRMVQKLSFTSYYFQDIWQNLSRKLNVNELAEAAMLAKTIWTRRNKFIHQESFCQPMCSSQKLKMNLVFFFRSSLLHPDQQRLNLPLTHYIAGANLPQGTTRSIEMQLVTKIMGQQD